MAEQAGSDEGATNKSDLNSMMEHLGLQEEDLDDVVFEEFVEDPEANPRWLAVVKVYTEKRYSRATFFRSMRAAWDLPIETRFRPLEENLYSIKFRCLAEWERA